MDSGSINLLLDAKTEYGKQLANILKAPILRIIKSVYNDADALCHQENTTDNVLMVFQDNLSRIPKWDTGRIKKEYDIISKKEGGDWLDDLLKIIYITHIKILTIVSQAKKGAKIQINAPTGTQFIHLVLTEVAREIWKCPYLCCTNVTKTEYQKNMREVESIITSCIDETIRKQLPVKKIVTEYLEPQLGPPQSELTLTHTPTPIIKKTSIVEPAREPFKPVKIKQKPVPFTLNYKPTPGGLKHSGTSVPRHSEAQPEGWAYNRVSTVQPTSTLPIPSKESHLENRGITPKQSSLKNTKSLRELLKNGNANPRPIASTSTHIPPEDLDLPDDLEEIDVKKPSSQATGQTTHVQEPEPEPAKELVQDQEPEPAKELVQDQEPEPAKELVQDPTKEPVLESEPEPAKEPVQEPENVNEPEPKIPDSKTDSVNGIESSLSDVLEDIDLEPVTIKQQMSQTPTNNQTTHNNSNNNKGGFTIDTLDNLDIELEEPEDIDLRSLQQSKKEVKEPSPKKPFVFFND